MGWRSKVVDSLHSYEAPAAAAGPTALDVTKVVSLLTALTDGTQDLYTLADTQVEQIKIVYCIGGTDTLKITPANFKDYTYFELDVAGDYAVLKFTGAEWEPLYLGRNASAT